MHTVQVEQVERFVAREQLEAANVRVHGEDFPRFFLDKGEENRGRATLAIYRLEGEATNAPILADLGDRAAIFLAHLFELLKGQARGESGPLRTNGVNIAYIRDHDGQLQVVNFAWGSGSKRWNMAVAGHWGEWPKGAYVISCI
ncbi:MAG: hypothetical protein WD850_03195 [Candidatus Spechtbacterales bacterium]